MVVLNLRLGHKDQFESFILKLFKNHWNRTEMPVLHCQRTRDLWQVVIPRNMVFSRTDRSGIEAAHMHEVVYNASAIRMRQGRVGTGIKVEEREWATKTLKRLLMYKSLSRQVSHTIFLRSKRRRDLRLLYPKSPRFRGTIPPS